MTNAKITSMPAVRLSPGQIEAWSRLQQADEQFASPYFRPEFTLAASDACDDVEVAVVEQNDEWVAFFPYQRRRGNVGGPVGGRLSDFHGVVAAPDALFSAEDLLGACDLRAWDFDHLVASQSMFEDYHWSTSPSPWIDVSYGYDAYFEDRSKSGSKRLKGIARKARKLAREVGPLRFVPHDEDPRAFETVLAWKSGQYEASGIVDLFSFDWIVGLLRRVLEIQTPEFAGMLPTLYAGDRLVAADLSMRSGDVLHSWFPAYDPEFSSYSPGHVLTIELLRRAEEIGFRRLDLGKGDESYKESLASDATILAEGSVDRRLIYGVVKKTIHQTYKWARQSSFSDSLRRPVRAVRRLLDQKSV